jgi:uncharacterized metal-binding protein YceD (DUF177 family)
MLRRGKILLSTLSSTPQSYQLTQEEPWIRDVLMASAPDTEVIGMSAEEWTEKSRLDVEIEISKLPGGEDFSIRGSLKADVPTVCARCASVLNVARSGNFQLYIKLVDKFRGGESDDSGDPDLIFVDHPDLDLRGLVVEQLVILEPFAEVPEKDSSGNPHICSKIPEFEAGQEPVFEASSPFSKLAVLKEDN